MRYGYLIARQPVVDRLGELEQPRVLLPALLVAAGEEALADRLEALGAHVGAVALGGREDGARAARDGALGFGLGAAPPPHLCLHTL